MFSLVHYGAPRSRRVHSTLRGFTREYQVVVLFNFGTRGFTPTGLEVVGYIRIRVALLGRAEVSSCSVCLA